MSEQFKVGPALTTEVSGDEYMEILSQRLAAWEAKHGESKYPPLLEWFIRDEDESLVRLPNSKQED